LFWVAFHLGVFAALAVDLFTDRAHDRISLRSAIWRSLLWVALSLSFNALVWWWRGADQAIDFFTGYLIEYSLSVDNIFVFGIIFAYFRVPPRYEHRVLIWGIVGALVMRAIMIGLGVALVSRFHFVLYLFGAFLVITGLRMLSGKSQPVDLEHNFRPAHHPAVDAGDERLSWAEVHRARRRTADADSARPGRDRDRNDGPDFRGRFNSGRARHHPGHLHCLHLEHLRDSRPAFALLPACQSGHPLCLSAVWARDHSLLRRVQNAGGTVDQIVELALAPDHSRGARP
jgi:hypothetical protein